jgi:hemolysin activation/secretion protein
MDLRAWPTGRRPSMLGCDQIARSRWVAAMILLAGLSGAGHAQTSPLGVPAVRPDQNVPVPRTRPQPPREAAPVKQGDQTFVPFLLKQVTIDGSSLPAEQLSAAYRPLVGQTIDAAKLAELAEKVGAAYAASDIALYTILVPGQEFVDGKVKLMAVEGYVGAVEVRGKLRDVRRSVIRNYLRRLEVERPLRKATLQRVVSLMRDIPGFYPELSLAQGGTQGAVKLVITANEKPVQAAFGINDRGTALLGRTQGQGDIYFNGLFAGADQLHVTGVAPTNVSRFQFVSGSYATLLNDDGTTIQGNLGYLRTRPPVLEVDGELVRLRGRSVSFGAQLSHPLIRSYERNLYATLGIDGSNSHNALLGLLLSNDRARAMRTALSFSATSKRNQFSATASFGINGLGARTVPGQADKSFRKLNLRLSESRQLGRDFVLRMNGFTQVTDDRLPGAEQIALGGDEFGRAYEAALISGDRGYAGSSELAWRPQIGTKLLQGSEFYVFGDGGHVTYRGRFGAQETNAHLASVGGGARVVLGAKAIAQVEAVRGLTNPVVYVDRKKTRVLFSLRSAI